MELFLKKIDDKMGDLEYEMYQEIPKEETGAENVANGLSYQDFQIFIQKKIKEANLSKRQSARLTYIMYRDNYPVGEVAIRSKLNKYWANHSGNIGYKIRPSERRKGYGTMILKLALEECPKIELDEVFLQCNKYNRGSLKVIEKNNGSEYEEDERSKYYKIKLK